MSKIPRNKGEMVVSFHTHPDVDKIDVFQTNPFIIKSKDGVHSWMESIGGVRDKDGTPKDLIIMAPTQDIMGFKYKIDTATQVIKGITTRYPLCDKERVDNMTEEEKWYFDLITKCVDSAKPIFENAEKLVKDIGKDFQMIADSYDLQENKAKKEKREINWDNLIKKAISKPSKLVNGNWTDEIDEEKPEKMSLIINGGGRGDNYKTWAKIYGKNGKPIDPTKHIIVDKEAVYPGAFTPVVKFGGAFWGNHGIMPYKASHRFIVVDGNYFLNDNSNKEKRYLPVIPQTEDEEEVPPVEEEEDNTPHDTSQGNNFPNPDIDDGSSEEDEPPKNTKPLDVLKAKSKSKPKSSKTPKKSLKVPKTKK